MNWNHRLMARTYPGTSEIVIEMYEVYYDKNDIPNGCSTNPQSVMYHCVEDEENSDDILKSLTRCSDIMIKAMSKPILWYDDGKFPNEYKK